MKITTHVGSLVDAAVGAHAIVNAGNPGLALGSGVSGAIREACGGHAFQAEIRERLEEEFDAELEPTDCLVTSAGTSSAFRWVLHVASVKYTQPDPQTGGATGPRRIHDCTLAMLSEAATLAREQGLTGRFVVATPLLGAGSGGLGPIPAADVMLGALAEHLREAGPEQRDVLARIVFVVLKPQDARMVEHAAAKYGLVSG